jgi:3-deoxy-D-manno-octulosonic-acid transferase
MIRKIYNAVFILGFWLSSPFYFLKMWRRGSWRKGFRQRFGRFDAKIKQSLTNRHVIWLHAVSVGEVGVVVQLIRGLEPRVPNLKIVVSTTTSTGMAELQNKLPSHILKIYYPIDRHRYVRRALSVLGPEAVVLVEAEIWPNFLWQAQRQRVPVFLVNARISEKSFRRYRWFGFLFRPLFASLAGVGVQNEEDGRRLVTLGCDPDHIHVLGNLKFDSAKLEERRTLDVPQLFQQLGLPDNVTVLLGGSTHAGEEAILAETFLRLRQRFPTLFLVLVPRHQERGKEVGQELEKRGLRFVYRTLITGQSKHEPGTIDCLLVNTTGELKFFYEHATVVFVGKSLTAQGGQNPIEPASMGKAVVFGPHMNNFAPIAADLVAAQAARRVASPAELESAIATLLDDALLRLEMGRRAIEVVNQNRGSLERTIDMIIPHLRQEDIYVADDAAR